MVREFVCVFIIDLSGVHQKRVINFVIDLDLSIKTISISSYLMDLSKLEEFKEHRGFVEERAPLTYCFSVGRSDLVCEEEK